MRLLLHSAVLDPATNQERPPSTAADTKEQSQKRERRWWGVYARLLVQGQPEKLGWLSRPYLRPEFSQARRAAGALAAACWSALYPNYSANRTSLPPPTAATCAPSHTLWRAMRAQIRVRAAAAMCSASTCC